jgi:hypothetical protein
VNLKRKSISWIRLDVELLKKHQPSLQEPSSKIKDTGDKLVNLTNLSIYFLGLVQFEMMILLKNARISIKYRFQSINHCLFK